MDEAKKRLLQAQGVNEVAQILREVGDDEANAEEVWQEVRRLREQEGKSLSLDELEAVAGGGNFPVTKRDWVDDGCAATVEPGSSCWGADGGCKLGNIQYTRAPYDISCPYCGARYTTHPTYCLAFDDGTFAYECLCRECRRYFYLDGQNRKWTSC